MEREGWISKGTHSTTETMWMPLMTHGIHDHFRDRLPTPFAFGGEAVGMTIHTPSVAVLLHERGGRVKGL